MDDAAFTVEGLVAPPGMDVRQDADGTCTLALSGPAGTGTMTGRPASAHLWASVVDFRCARCPNPAFGRASSSRWPKTGTWFSVNLCTQGRCEVDVPGAGLAVARAGDVCLSYSRAVPAEFRYPLGRYRGVEVFASTSVGEDPAFHLLKEEGVSVADLVRRAGDAAVFFGDDELVGHMRRIGAALAAHDDVRVRYEFLGLMLALARRDLAAARPVRLLTAAQTAIVRSVHDALEADLAAPHDARVLAARCGVSATTLNAWFSYLYGCTVAAYLRQRRIEAAGDLMRAGATVAEAAARVGYANPSKFAAAFKRACGAMPSEYRRRERLA